MQKIIILVLILLVVLCLGATKQEPTEVDRIDRAIHFILSKGLPKHKIFPHPRHKVVKDPELRLQIALAIQRASEAKKVPAPLLIATGFREGSFKASSVGKLGEKSMFQMMGRTARLAQKLDSRCALDTVEGSAMCSATWLKHWYKKCGDWQGSLTLYATGGPTCKPQSSHVEWLTRDRLGIARKISRKFWGKGLLL